MAMPQLNAEQVIQKYKDSKMGKLILLDYDGTLTTTHKLPEFAKPSPKILEQLKTLSAQPDTYVYILSGRGRQHLDSWFENTGIGLR